jgi:hypothetical protein
VPDVAACVISLAPQGREGQLLGPEAGLGRSRVFGVVGCGVGLGVGLLEVHELLVAVDGLVAALVAFSRPS